MSKTQTPKPTRAKSAWAIVDRGGNIIEDTIRRTKKDAVATFRRFSMNTWVYDRDTRGFRVERVEITPAVISAPADSTLDL